MKRDKKIVIATHGYLADGLVSALEIIVGDISNVTTICGYTSSDFNLDQTIQNIMKQHDFETYDLIVCTDMMGGSVNNGFVKYLEQYPFHLITNTNLAFLVDLLLTTESVNKTLLNEKVKDDLVSVKYINSMLENFHDADDL